MNDEYKKLYNQMLEYVTLQEGLSEETKIFLIKTIDLSYRIGYNTAQSEYMNYLMSKDKIIDGYKEIVDSYQK